MYQPETDLPLILLLEDSEEMARIYKLFLAEFFEVVYCPTVSSAAEMITLGQCEFDIVVSDYHLPDGTCFDVYKTYKLLKGDGMPPWLLITVDPEGVKYSADQEGLMVLPKPVQQGPLIKRLQGLMEKNKEDWDKRREIRKKQRKYKQDPKDQREGSWD